MIQTMVPEINSHSKPLPSIVRLGLAALVFTTFAASAADNSSVFNVLDFGAQGDGTINDTGAIQKAIDACAANGGGQVLLPGGKTFRSGAISLPSDIDFHLARGAVLKGSERWQDYGQAGALLFAMDATNITISGD